MNPKQIAIILSVLAYSSLASDENGMVSLSQEDVDKLKAYYKQKHGSDLVLEGLSFDEDNMASFAESEILLIEAALAKDASASQPEESANPPAGGNAEVAELQRTVKDLTATVKKLQTANAKAQENIIRLGASAEPDLDRNASPAGKVIPITHSRTHAFGSTHSFDAFVDRPWNQRLAGQRKYATDYTPINISKINEDLGAYYKENRAEYVSFLRAINRLPKFWNIVTGVQDEIVYSKLMTGEFTQARKKKWLPKGDFEFQPEKAKIYPIQIDTVIKGYELQSLETSWMNHIETIKNSGSTAYKMSFVAFLAQEILKKAAEEDQISLIRGVVFPTADDATVPGRAIHKLRGVLKLIKEAQQRRVYKPYSLGTPTPENIIDYVDRFVMMIPEYWRDMPGLVLYMSTKWVDTYIKAREQLKGLMPTYEPGKTTIDRHENILLYGLSFTNDSDFMFITTNDNISILVNVDGENNILEMEKDKRDINIFGDYKLGIHVWAFGYQWPEDTDMTDEKQMFFSNDCDILPDVYIPIEPDVTIPSVKYHTSIQTGENTVATVITNLKDYNVGDYIYIKGNSGAKPSTIENGDKFDLASDITLDENTLILLYVRGDGDFVEIERWNLALSNIVYLAADATKCDASQGKHFVTVANTAATEITDIENAVDGDVYKIEGGDDTDSNSSTISQSGKFSRIKADIRFNYGNYLVVKFNGTKFVELDSYQAP